MAGGLTLRRGGALIGCTLAVAALLVGLDRLALGPPPPRGWQRVPLIADLPRAITAPAIPPYVPPQLTWPPAVLRYRLTPRGRDDGLWLGLRAVADEIDVAMWIGRGRREAHAVLGAAARCLTERCPAGWRVGRVQAAAAADRLWVITRLARRELERVVEALSHATER